MSTPLKNLSPSAAWEETAQRSMVIGIAGWVVLGCLNAAGAFPDNSRTGLWLASGSESAFLAALAIMVADFHERWRLAVVAATLALALPFLINLLWIRISGRSLIYPFVAVILLGVMSVWVAHYKISGPRWEDDSVLEAELREMDGFKFTWDHRVWAICLLLGILLLIMLLVRWAVAG